MYCQKCRCPLRPDDTLANLNPASFKLLAEASGELTTSTTAGPATGTGAGITLDRHEHYVKASKDARTPAFKRAVTSKPSYGGSQNLPGMARNNPAMSFVMLSDSQVAPPADVSDMGRSPRGPTRRPVDPAADQAHLLSSQMSTTDRLFEILSARSDIDHPICVECTEVLIEGLQQKLATATKERDAYVDFLRQANADVPSEEEQRQAHAELKAAQDREEAAFTELEGLEHKKAELDEKILALELEGQELDLEEHEFWAERNAFADKLSAFQNEKDRINNKLDHDTKQLHKLQRTSVYNDTFCIGHDGYFGTINGLRLGRLPDKSVEWPEINAAWGQTCLLLVTVAERLGYSFKGYRICPMGSHSIIERIEYPQTRSNAEQSHASKPKVTHLDLFCTGDAPLGLTLFHRRFDTAMVAFLECLRQLGDFVESGQARRPSGSSVQAMKLPYKIEKDRINDASIKLGGFNQEESWTKACKFTLICCKYLLAHASQMSTQPV
ncbi:APG6-domain-containing protein [Eremomyces bilateralis CBS 781.70]|uniref:APG6-domain-containing protein n=1 Tax=Eremomyces bilateralis CBS 781.70 TaxID=1392243 RepID=A0A6G1FYB7_9PEZI|nr:APG6-domain-containing protein [Eremomyces bilateralis CBS 781.70]KAF1810690.1 APG6-domain-containing protein [Eremomyces bilateralis CBS 781.70]